MCGLTFLIIFGVLAVIRFIQAYITRSGLLIALLTLLAYFVLSQILVFIGFGYISLGLHEYLNKKVADSQQR